MWNIEMPDYDDILAHLIFSQSESWRIIETNAPATVAITAYRNGPNTVIHLVNGTGTIPLDKPIPVGPIQIILNNKAASGCRWFAPGAIEEELDIQSIQENGAFGITIQKLHDYGMVVIE